MKTKNEKIQQLGEKQKQKQKQKKTQLFKKRSQNRQWHATKQTNNKYLYAHACLCKYMCACMFLHVIYACENIETV